MKWTYISRWIRVKFMRFFFPSDRVKRPTGLSNEEKLALEIWQTVVLSPTSVLLYNPLNSECVAEWHNNNHPVFLFLESDRIRIINSDLGYDVPLDSICEKWCHQIFTHEVHRRRTAYKEAAMARVNNSLTQLEEYLLRNAR